MNIRFLKKSVLAAILLTGITSTTVWAQVLTFNSVSGFSDTQGANGWSYAGVHFSQADDLITGQVLGIYNVLGASWDVTIPGASGVSLTATTQNYQPGNSVWSLRYWTADQSYTNVSLSSFLEATVPLQALLVFCDISAASQTIIEQTSATKAGIDAGGGTEALSLNGAVSGVETGDRIYFLMMNAGTEFDNSTQQVWNQTVTATVPEPSTVALMALGACFGLWRLRKNARLSV